MNQTEKEKEADQARLASLGQTKENIAKMGDYEANLKELCTRIVPDIDNCTSQDKKDAYTYLDSRITATPECVDIKGYLKSDIFRLIRAYSPLDEHGHHCSVVGIHISREKAMLCQGCSHTFKRVD